MRGYRQALNLSYQLPSMLGGNSSDVESCDSQDDVDTSAILASEQLCIPFCVNMDPSNERTRIMPDTRHLALNLALAYYSGTPLIRTPEMWPPPVFRPLQKSPKACFLIQIHP